MKFGLTQVKAGIASILSKYDVTTFSKTEIPVKFSKQTFVSEKYFLIFMRIAELLFQYFVAEFAAGKWNLVEICEAKQIKKVNKFGSVKLQKHNKTIKFYKNITKLS